MAKTANLSVYVKDPDGWGHVSHVLGLSDEVSRAHFEFGEYATVELEFDESLRVVGGRIVPLPPRPART